MPRWELNEILDMRAKLYPTVSPERVQKLYNKYGGTVRYLLTFPSGNDVESEDLTPFKDAISRCAPDDVSVL